LLARLVRSTFLIGGCCCCCCCCRVSAAAAAVWLACPLRCQLLFQQQQQLTPQLL
jgi:hypothetical protein